MNIPIKLTLLTSLTMLAFAANSIFNRLSLAQGEIGPADFAFIRTLSGALVLFLLVTLQAKKNAANASTKLISSSFSNLLLRLRSNLPATLSLTLYLLAFSFAYIALDTGIGALILFGGVQITMFIGALYLGEKINRQRGLGALLAIIGMLWLLAPSPDSSLPLLEALLMGGAAIGWGLYTLMGRKVAKPLQETQINFLLAVPFVALVCFLLPDQTPITAAGATYALLSGAVTSGVGYALWYAILPKLETITASVAQLTVPVIAMLGGVLFLDEAITLRFLLAATLIVIGVLITSGAISFSINKHKN